MSSQRMDTEKFPFSKVNTASVIVAISLVLGLGFDLFFYGKSLGIGFPIYVGLIVEGLLIVSVRVDRTPDNQVLWLLIPLAFFSSMVFVRSSDLLSFLNVVASLLLLLLIAELSLAKA